MKKFFEEASLQNHPIRHLIEFLEKERAYEIAEDYNNLRFAGYVFKIGFKEVEIITADPYKLCVGGIPRNSLLIMVPVNWEELPPHFTLLRVLDTSETPLEKEVQETYFELHKKSMPELDVFTQSELQWGALLTEIIGMFYPHPVEQDTLEFSGDINNFVSAHNYRVFAPNNELLDLIINSMVSTTNRFHLGDLRMTECRLPLPGKPLPNVPIYISTDDFLGTRTAMFGKTRLGKSNVIKLIAQSLIETTQESNNVGQLIFDINGEYANDNPQDESRSLRSVHEERCHVYALTRKPGTPSSPLKIDFYDQPEQAHRILGSLLRSHQRDSAYVNAFISIELMSVEEAQQLEPGSDRYRAVRKIQLFWAILRKAGYEVNEARLRGRITGRPSGFNPNFAEDIREAAYASQGIEPTPPAPNSISDLVREFEIMARYRRDNPDLRSSSGNLLFDDMDIAMLEFLEPLPNRAGTILIQPYRQYHDRNAGDFINETIQHLDNGHTVILDLGNANEEIMRYFSDDLSRAVFNHQVDKFTNNNLGNHYIQLYFEEAHNLFPPKEDTSIYTRFAKEGAKFNIGMVYSTQSPTTINKDLLAQTENFFVAHLSSRDEINSLARLNVSYDSLKEDILQAKTIGYIRMLTRSHRFVVPVQARKFSPVQEGDT
jgi:hypothetical protein